MQNEIQRNRNDVSCEIEQLRQEVKLINARPNYEEYTDKK